MKYIKSFNEAIKIDKSKSKGKIKEHYTLIFNYMIGDANGYTREKVDVSIDNPFVERFVLLLNGLQPVPGKWGVGLDYEEIEKQLKENRITKDDYLFLMRTLFEDCDEKGVEDYFSSKKDNEFANEFHEGVKRDTEYSFLVFQDVKLKHISKNGKERKTKIKSPLNKDLFKYESGKKYELMPHLQSRCLTENLRKNPTKSEINKVREIFSDIIKPGAIEHSKYREHFVFSEKEKSIYFFTKYGCSTNVYKYDDEVWVIHLPTLVMKYSGMLGKESESVEWVYYKLNGLSGMVEFYKNERNVFIRSKDKKMNIDDDED